jgi:hypothetical protein
VQHTLFLILMHNAHAQQLTVDPESIIPLSDKFDMEIPAPDVPPEITRFLGAWIGTWHDDRHILVVERVNPDGHATWFSRNRTRLSTNSNREWWRDEAISAGGVLTMTGFRTFRYTFDGPDRLYLTATQKWVRRRHLRDTSPTWRALLRVIDRSIGRGPRASLDSASHGPDSRWHTADRARRGVLSARRPWPGAARNLHARVRRRPESTEDLVIFDRGALASRQWICRAGADAPRTRHIRGNQWRGRLWA